MNALEAASLVMIPSGYEDGTLGSLKPIDGSGDFTFSRGSNLSATRVKEDGYIEKGYENLLLQSNSFLTSPWSFDDTSVTGGQAGYDGSSDAWLLENTATSPPPRIFQNISTSSVVTFSVYAKAGTNNIVRLVQIGGNTAQAYFDLNNGTITYESSAIDSVITSIGNGWYRCSIAFSGSTTSLRIYTGDGLNSFPLGNIYIQDAQLNQGLVALPYVESGATNGLGGLLENEPRIDFTGGGCGSLLLEPSRTNSVPLSEYILGMSGLGGGTSTLVWNTSIQNPEGHNGVTEYTEDSYVRKSDIITGLSLGDKISYSIFAKSDSNQSLVLGGQFGGESANFNVNTGTLVSQGANCDSYDIIDYGNGWHRYVVNITYQNSIGNGFSYAYFEWNSNTESVYLWGWQAERDATYKTSYIPTYGVSQTRLRDSAAELSNDIISGATEFTWLFDNTGTELDGQVNVVFQLVCTETALRYYSSQGGRFFAGGYFGEADAIGKLCVKYDGTTITMFKDGIKSTSTSSTNLGTTIYLDNLFTSNNVGTPVKLNQMLFFKTALSDSECIALTTI